MASRALAKLWHTFVQRAATLELSLSPSITLHKLRAHRWVASDLVYVAHVAMAAFWITLLPSLALKLVIPLGFTALLLVPLTSQFFLPAIPILQWVLTFYASRFIPAEYRPAISVSLLPTLETVLYGANISDILTRFTHPVLDIVAWIPYGVVHFSGPFILAAFLWLFAPKPALRFWANAFGYMNTAGVVIQILLPCAAPWYELIHGLTPANYSMKGSPGGLARIDALFHSSAYTVGFSNAPVVFGAFPSLHSAIATLEALFVSHFFGRNANGSYNWRRTAGWGYAGVLYWSTMYLTHHYLIDVTSGACLAIAFFYLFLPTELVAPPLPAPRSKYELYDIDVEEGPLARKDAVFRRPHSNTFSSTSSADEPLDSAGGAEDMQQPASSDPDEDGDIGASYRPPPSAVPFFSRLTGRPKGGAYKKIDRDERNTHKRTASIASLIGPDERSADEGWGAWGIVPPAVALRGGSVRGDVTPRTAAAAAASASQQV